MSIRFKKPAKAVPGPIYLPSKPLGQKIAHRLPTARALSPAPRGVGGFASRPVWAAGHVADHRDVRCADRDLVQDRRELRPPISISGE